jgi:hypothetical protein
MIEPPDRATLGVWVSVRSLSNTQIFGLAGAD